MRCFGYYQVIVIGGGHAGTEAALAVARMGLSVLLITHRLEALGQMSCNPAIGGIGKGHLVKEIDAMGGIMAKAADRAGIHFRILNARKGAAVRATRAQTDRLRYGVAIRKALENQSGLTLLQDPVEDLIMKGERVTGVITQMGQALTAEMVILTAGTFLAGRIHVGEVQYTGGRLGDPAATRLAERLRELPLRVGRLKTGTPPRLDGNTIDFDQLMPQAGDEPTPVFSFTGKTADHPQQIRCHITRTNERTHAIIRNALDRSPVYSGEIASVGPRYCPSIEDKVVRFADKSGHQIFLEPEGLDTQEVYPNGISTGLPLDVQYDLVRSIAGMESAHITRPGYAIEYDFFDPRDLRQNLECSSIENLFFAGQINGTTGYEEAAAQGLLAGINAVQKIRGEPAWVPGRHEAYLGVMLDDLLTRGTQEPYRMFTSRAEYRLLLREDNADLRLTPPARALGLIDEARWEQFSAKQAAIENEKQRLQATWIRPNDIDDSVAQGVFNGRLNREYTLSELLARPNLGYQELKSIDPDRPAGLGEAITKQIETQFKYAGYIERQLGEVARQRAQGEQPIPVDIDYASVTGLSVEVTQRLTEHRPKTIAQAANIAGITPAAISLLLVHLKKNGKLAMPSQD